jgi:hypothetical protein
MDEISLPHEIEVFGHSVPTFPNGIDHAFQALIDEVKGGFSRSFFGICTMIENKMVYYAMAEVKHPDERTDSNFIHLKIEKGNYITTEVKDWRSRTSTLNEVFLELLQHPDAEKHKPSVEWYKNEHEMLCMIKKRT